MPANQHLCLDCGVEIERNGNNGPWPLRCPTHRAEAATAQRRVATRKHNRATRYGITEEFRKALFDLQGGLCAICWTAPAEHLDHDHETGEVRGLLCLQCNAGLGQFRDSKALVTSALEYL